MRPVIVLTMLLLATLACALSGGSDSEPTAIPIQNPLTLTAAAGAPQTTVTPTPTLQATPTTFTSNTTGGSTTGGSTTTDGSTSNCVVRSDWAVYTVKAGETLGIIAASISSSVGELVSGNCLANADTIFVGQQLRVPRLPTTTTGGSTTSGSTTTTGGSTTSGSTTTGGSTTSGSTTTGGSTTSGSTTTGGSTTGGNTAGGDPSKAPQFAQSMTVKPTTVVTGGVLTQQATVQLDTGILDDADTVKYYANTSASVSGAVLVGTDTDPFDGTPINYTFNAFDDELYFWAVAENEFGATQSNVVHVFYDPNFNNQGNITIAPFIGFDGGLYTLQYGATVTLTWQNAPTDPTRVDFYFAPGGANAQVVGTDANPSDGSAVGWVVPEWILGTVYATAFYPDGRTQDSPAFNVYSEGASPNN